MVLKKDRRTYLPTLFSTIRWGGLPIFRYVKIMATYLISAVIMLIFVLITSGKFFKSPMNARNHAHIALDDIGGTIDYWSMHANLPPGWQPCDQMGSVEFSWFRAQGHVRSYSEMGSRGPPDRVMASQRRFTRRA